MLDQVKAQVRNLVPQNGGERHRPQHAKMLAGIRDANFIVSADIPVEIQNGFLQPSAVYPTIVRFSNAIGLIRKNDAEPDLRGIAIRIRSKDGKDQDFLMTNAEKHHAKNAVEAMATSFAFSKPGILQRIDNWFKGSGRGFLQSRKKIKKIDGILTGLVSLSAQVGIGSALRILKTLSSQMKVPVESLATETFWSRAPIRISEYAYKYRLLPNISKSEIIDIPTQDLKSELRKRLSTNDISFQFQLQPYIDEKLTPLEDARKPWHSEFITIGELQIPRQELQEDDGFFESIAFNPWNVNSDDLEPIGNMNRARKGVYVESVKARTEG